jgi:hypothetical protein
VPQQAPHLDSAFRCPAQRCADGRSVIGQQLIGIPSPTHEVDRVPLARRRQGFRQGLVVHAAVQQRTCRVGDGPGPQSGGGVASLDVRQNQSATEPSRGGPTPRAARASGSCSSPLGAPTTAAAQEPSGRYALTLARSTSSTCRSAINATRSRWRRARSTNTRGSWPPSSPTSRQQSSGLRSTRRSIAAVLRTLLPPTAQRGKKPRPVGSPSQYAVDVEEQAVWLLFRAHRRSFPEPPRRAIAASGDDTGRCRKYQGSTRVVRGCKPRRLPDIVDSACDGWSTINAGPDGRGGERWQLD